MGLRAGQGGGAWWLLRQLHHGVWNVCYALTSIACMYVCMYVCLCANIQLLVLDVYVYVFANICMYVCMFV